VRSSCVAGLDDIVMNGQRVDDPAVANSLRGERPHEPEQRIRECGVSGVTMPEEVGFS
jgi:hypothetical protein